MRVNRYVPDPEPVEILRGEPLDRGPSFISDRIGPADVIPDLRELVEISR